MADEVRAHLGGTLRALVGVKEGFLEKVTSRKGIYQPGEEERECAKAWSPGVAHVSEGWGRRKRGVSEPWADAGARKVLRTS